MQQLLQEVEGGIWSGVLVVEIERLARGDTVDQGIMAQTFKYSGTKIITPMKVYDPENEFDEEYFEFGLFMSRREYKTINRRLQRGRIASVKEGKFVSSTAPYGYEKFRIPNDKGFTLRPVEAEADIVRLIFQLYTCGELQSNGQMKQLGTYSIALRLDNMGIASPKSKSNWSDRTVKQILSNPVYIGKIRWKNLKNQKRVVDGVLTVERVHSSPEEQILVEGLHPALVSEKTFLKAQELLARKALPPVPDRSFVANPLAGILYCGKCGRSMQRTVCCGAEKLRCINRSCNNVSSYYSVVEEKLLNSLSQWLSEYRLKWSESTPDAEADLIELKQKAIKKTKNDISTLNKQLARTHDLLEQGIYDTEMFLRRSRSITERINAAEESLRNLSDELVEDEKRAANRRNIVPKVEKLLEVYNELPNAKAKNDMLKSVLEKVTYTKENRSAKTKPLDNFILEIYPRLSEK